MTLGDVAVGAKILIDAYIFVYACTPDPIFGPPCIHFFDCVRRAELDGAVTAHALSEPAHRIMSIEACATFGWSYKGIAARMKTHPAKLRQLDRHRQAISEIMSWGVRVLPIDGSDVRDAASTSQTYSLLSGDTLTYSLMLHHGFEHIASNDSDFDGLPRISRYAPT